jgi:hypothetical protein
MIFIIRIEGGGVELSPLGTPASEWPIVLARGDFDDGEFGGMKIGRGNRKYSEKTCPSATLSTTNHTCQTRARIQAAAVGNQRLTAWAMVRPPSHMIYFIIE